MVVHINILVNISTGQLILEEFDMRYFEMETNERVFDYHDINQIVSFIENYFFESVI
ncbi:MAG: hypothetical protein LUH02_06220 [Erysipelotrichaceae bacterium]|nr:hypothetical protein [Erysipelotrichaceae bacterium]